CPCRTDDRLYLRRRTVGLEVERDHVISHAEATAHRPLAAARRIPRKAHARSKVVPVVARLVEDERRTSQIGDRVQLVPAGALRISEELIAQAGIDRQ